MLETRACEYLSAEKHIAVFLSKLAAKTLMFQCFKALLLLKISKRREEKGREANITFYTLVE